MDSVWSTFYYIAIMVAVILAAYFVTKYISKKTKRITKSKYLNVLERMAVTKDKQILLFKVGNKHLLIGISNQSVDLITTIEKDELESVVDVPKDDESFLTKIQGIINTAKGSQKNLKNARMKAKEGKKNRISSERLDDDILEKMNNAVQQRKNRLHKKSEDEDIE